MIKQGEIGCTYKKEEGVGATGTTSFALPTEMGTTVPFGPAAVAGTMAQYHQTYP